MSSRTDRAVNDPLRLAQAISTSESSYSQSHIQSDSLRFPSSTTVELPPCDHAGPNTPMRQSTHRTGAPMQTVAEVKRQLMRELHGGREELKDVSQFSIYPNIRGITTEKIKAYLSKTEHYDTKAKRWSSIPDGDPREDDLYSPFTKIMQEILRYFGLDLASVEDTHKAKLTSLEEHQMKFVDDDDKEVLTKTSPDICIMGTGSKFRRRDSDTPSYFFCVAPVEIKTKKMLKKVGLDEVVLQIAVYVR